MIGLLILFVIGTAFLMKWISTVNSNAVVSNGGSMEVEVQSEGNGGEGWKENIEGELVMIQGQLDFDDLSKAERQKLEADEQILKYRLEHSVAPLGHFDRESMLIGVSSIGGTVILLTVIVAAGIVASEFSQGTIKMLLSRPVKRWKILTSKLLTVYSFGFLLLMIGFIVHLLLAFLLFNASSGQLLTWNGSEVIQASVWGKSFYMLLLTYGNVFVIATFAFMIGSVFRSSSLAIGLSLFIYFTGSTVVYLVAKYEVAKYLLFTHMDLTQFETGMQVVKGLTMPFSLTVLAVYMLIFIVTSYATFNMRDVKA